MINDSHGQNKTDTLRAEAEEAQTVVSKKIETYSVLRSNMVDVYPYRRPLQTPSLLTFVILPLPINIVRFFKSHS